MFYFHFFLPSMSSSEPHFKGLTRLIVSPGRKMSGIGLFLDLLKMFRDLCQVIRNHFFLLLSKTFSCPKANIVDNVDYVDIVQIFWEGYKNLKNVSHFGFTLLICWSCHFNSASNVGIGIECWIFLIVIFLNAAKFYNLGHLQDIRIISFYNSNFYYHQTCFWCRLKKSKQTFKIQHLIHHSMPFLKWHDSHRSNLNFKKKVGHFF